MANKPIRIGGTLYPSQEWYDENVAKKTNTPNTPNTPTTLKPTSTEVGDSPLPKEEAMKGVEEAFQTSSPEQEAALKKVRESFFPDETPDLSDGETPKFNIQEPESPVDAAQRILDTSAVDAELAKIQAERDKRTKDYEDRIKELQEEKRSWAEKASDFIKGRSVEERQEELMEEYKIPEYMEEASGALLQAKELQQRAISLGEQRDASISAVSQQSIATPFISRQESKIREDYDRRISTVSAMAGVHSAYAQAVQGQVSQARGLVSDIVQAYTYDTELELNRINMFMDLNSEEIGMLDRDYQNALQETQRYWKNRLQTQRADKEAVMNLMLQYPKAGVSIEDTPQEAAQKAAQWSESQIYSPDWQLRTVGDTLYRVDPQTGALEPLAEGESKTAKEELISDIMAGVPYEQALIYYGEDLSKSYIDDMFSGLGRGEDILREPGDLYGYEFNKEGKLVKKPTQEDIRKAEEEAEEREAERERIERMNLLQRIGYKTGKWVDESANSILQFITGKK